MTSLRKLISVGQLRPNEEVRDPAYAQRLADTANPRDLEPLFVLSDSLVILDGHHRWQAAKIAGWGELPVVFVPEDDYYELIYAGWYDDEAVEHLTGWSWDKH